MELEIGTVFNTPFETGCIVTSELTPFKNGRTTGSSFLALDSEGVECQFSTNMVVGHQDFKEIN